MTEPLSLTTLLGDLEGPISDAVRMMDALKLLLEAQLVPIAPPPSGDQYCRLEPWEYDALLFVAENARDLVDKIDERWREAAEQIQRTAAE